MYVSKSYNNLEAFQLQLEQWFDDSMNRVSGWYKRQTQFLLFAIGLVVALLFNVNMIAIAGKLSTDKDARDKLVTMAIKEADALKNDPRVKKKAIAIEELHAKKEAILTNTAATDSTESKQLKTLDQQIDKEEVAMDSLKKEYTAKRDSIQHLLKKEIKEANNLLALGWGDYGIKKNKTIIITCYNKCYKKNLKSIHLRDAKSLLEAKNKYIASKGQQKKVWSDSITKRSLIYHDAEALKIRAFKELCEKREYCIKASYIASQVFTFRNFLGYLLLAVGVCLGAPFWFDLLQKLIKLRSSGKKEETEPATTSGAQPIQVNVNNNTTPTAIG